jgi:NAD+ kinase
MVFGILGNTTKENIGEILEELTSIFRKHKINYNIDSLFRKISPGNINKKHFLKQKEIIKNSDIIISLGGDGTFLNTARIIGKHQKPILGINLGNLGFLSEIGMSEVESFLTDIIKGKYKILDLCLISSNNPAGQTIYGLNEIVIDKANSVRMIEIDVYYKNEKVVRFVADGVIVSTPTGSTGYSLSSGGSIISPSSKVFIITPVSPHTLNLRPIIVPDEGEIVIKTYGFKNIRQTADGNISYIFNAPAEFTLRKADFTVKVIKRLKKTYFDTLNKKLLWGVDKRKYRLPNNKSIN